MEQPKLGCGEGLKIHNDFP